MKFSQDSTDTGHAIQDYSQGQVTISGMTYQSSLIVTPSRVIPDWRPEIFSKLSASDFEGLAELEPEIVILGTGAVQRFPHPTLGKP